MITALLLCAAPVVVDGDTIKCSGVGRVRMVVIDTPDKLSSLPCRKHYGNHVCDDAKANAATDELRTFMTGKRVTYRVLGYDTRNHRVVAQLFAAGRDMQCHQLQARVARYLASYDRTYGYPILHRCPATVRKAWR